MLNLIDKYLDNFVNACDNIIEYILPSNKEYIAAYIIQTAYRKYLIRKYLKLKQEIAKDEQVWHMNFEI